MSKIGLRRSWSSSPRRSAASSGAMRSRIRAASSFDFERRNSTWCSASSSSKMSAVRAGSLSTASMISWPSSCEAPSMMSAICAGCRRRSRCRGIRSLAVGTWPTNGWMSFQSRMTWRRRSGRARRGSRRRSMACGLRSMPARYQPSEPGAWTALERLGADGVRLQAHGAGLEGFDDVLADEYVLRTDAHLHPGHGRIGAVGELDDEVLDASDLGPRGVQHRAAKDLRHHQAALVVAVLRSVHASVAHWAIIHLPEGLHEPPALATRAGPTRPGTAPTTSPSPC